MAQAAAAPLRHSWPWFLTRPSTASISAHLSSIFTPKSHTHDSALRSFSTATATRTHGLRRPSPSPVEADTSDDADADSDRKSRNELKREARRAVRWGMDLAEFSTPQIERIIRAASLEREVFNALMLVKRLGHDVREGKRRQFSYIGRLLRAAEPELMDALIQASKDGDNDRLLALSGKETWPVEDHEEEQETEDDEVGEKYTEIAARWFDGLMDKDPTVTNEVYSIHTVEFDRQELRKLVRQVQSIEEESVMKESEEQQSKATLTKAKKPLLRYLCWLAKESEMAESEGVASNANNMQVRDNSDDEG